MQRQRLADAQAVVAREGEQAAHAEATSSPQTIGNEKSKEKCRRDKPKSSPSAPALDLERLVVEYCHDHAQIMSHLPVFE